MESIVAAWPPALERVGDWCEIGRGAVLLGWRGAGRREGSGIDWDARLNCMVGGADAGREGRGVRLWRAPAASAGGALPRIARTPIATPNAKTRNDFIPPSWSLGRPTRPPDACFHIPPGPGAVPLTASHAATFPNTTLRPPAKVRLQAARALRARQSQGNPRQREGIRVNQESILEFRRELFLPPEESLEVVEARKVLHQECP